MKISLDDELALWRRRRQLQISIAPTGYRARVLLIGISKRTTAGRAARTSNMRTADYSYVFNRRAAGRSDKLAMNAGDNRLK
jgi:hypothetical protein